MISNIKNNERNKERYQRSQWDGESAIRHTAGFERLNSKKIAKYFLYNSLDYRRYHIVKFMYIRSRKIRKTKNKQKKINFDFERNETVVGGEEIAFINHQLHCE